MTYVNPRNERFWAPLHLSFPSLAHNFCSTSEILNSNLLLHDQNLLMFSDTLPFLYLFSSYTKNLDTSPNQPFLETFASCNFEAIPSTTHFLNNILSCFVLLYFYL